MQGPELDVGQKRLDQYKLVQSAHPQGGRGKAGDGSGFVGQKQEWQWEEGGGGSKDDSGETNVADDRKGVVVWACEADLDPVPGQVQLGAGLLKGLGKHVDLEALLPCSLLGFVCPLKLSPSCHALQRKLILQKIAHSDKHARHLNHGL